MHRSRFVNKTSTPGNVPITKSINNAKHKSSSLSSSSRLFIFVGLGMAGLFLPYYSFLSLYSSNQQSPVIKIPEKIEDTTPNWTLPELPTQIYQANFSKFPPPPPIHSQFLIYKGFMKGQGTGNHMNGLLATHLLALEFNRTVCVSPDYKEFHLAFRSRQPALQEACDPIIKEYNDNVNLRIMLNNFGKPPNECRLQQQLADRKQPVWVILANTYPRWPEVPPNFFFQYYEPTPALLAWLPYPQSPHTVVHLRTPDKHGADDRAGLDNATFAMLYQTLPSDTFLVTNNVAWYDHFPTWQHPAWTIVQHTASRGTIISPRGSTRRGPLFNIQRLPNFGARHRNITRTIGPYKSYKCGWTGLPSYRHNVSIIRHRIIRIRRFIGKTSMPGSFKVFIPMEHWIWSTNRGSGMASHPDWWIVPSMRRLRRGSCDCVNRTMNGCGCGNEKRKVWRILCVSGM